MSPEGVVIAGGGTLGHVAPALAVAHALVRRGVERDRILFVGAARGVETTLVPAAGFELVALAGRGIDRRSPSAAVVAAGGIAAATARAVVLLARRRPSVVLSVGGYASVPAVAAAAVLRIPVVIHEQNAVPGAANRLGARVARACAVSFPGTDLPRAVLTGNPVRPEVLAATGPGGRRAGRAHLGARPGEVVVLIFGGSLGARRINEAALDAAGALLADERIRVHHVAGRRDHDSLTARVPRHPRWRTVPFEERMPLAMAGADVVVCRAGASTVAELTVLGRPSILVPLPGAPGDHQTANARVLVGAGAACTVPDAELTGDRLAGEVLDLARDRPRRERMAGAARALGRPDAAEAVAELVEVHARRPRRRRREGVRGGDPRGDGPRDPDGAPARAGGDPPAGSASVAPSAAPTVDALLDGARHWHVMGVAGAGMSGVAVLLADLGHRVSGCDLDPGATRATGAGVVVVRGHGADHLEGTPGAVTGPVEALTHSTAVPGDHPELEAARRRGVPVLRRADVLAGFTRRGPTLAVAGTHGKTTTTAMCAMALTAAGMDPGYLVGADCAALDRRGVRWRQDRWFVVEADESDASFLELSVGMAVLTSVEVDHLERWGTPEALRAGFERFLDGVEGPRIVCVDPGTATGLAGRATVTYGTVSGADYRATRVRPLGSGSRFTLEHPGGTVEVSVPLPGVHNVRNATAALAAAIEAGADPRVAAEALGRPLGLARRFQNRGTVAGVTFVDDYAHLPTEVALTVAAARAVTPGRLVCVFQPHRHARTEALAAEFGPVFAGADLVVVCDVYRPAGEPPRPGVHAGLVVDAVRRSSPDLEVHHVGGDMGTVAAALRDLLREGDLCLTLGAGDVTRLPDLLAPLLEGSR